MDAKKTIILMSHSMRVARFFKEAALELKNDYDVIVFIDKEEERIWSDAKGIQLIPSENTFIQEAEKEGGNLKETARKIEKELSLSLFKSAGNYFLIRKFTRRNLSRWRKWIIDEKDTALKYYVGSYKILSKIINEKDVALIFYESTEIMQHKIALKIGYKHGVFALGFSFAYYKGKFFFNYGISVRNPLLEYYYKNRHLINAASYRAAQDMVENIKQSGWVPQEVKKHRRITEGLVNWKTFLFAAISKLFYGIMSLQPRKYITIIINAIWLNINSHRELPNEPYVSFLLQHQPEASTCSAIPRWVNQENIIEQLAINSPLDLKILVKEHIVNYGIRGKGYFKELCELPNVYLCSPGVDTKAVILKSEAVLALTGRPGFEAILLGKKVGILGAPFYSIYKGVKLLNYPEEIFSALEDNSWNPESMAEERLTFASAYVQSLYDFRPSTENGLWPKNGGDKWAYAIRDFLKKKDEYNLKPSMFYID